MFIPHDNFSDDIIKKDNIVKIQSILKFSENIINTFEARFVKEEYFRVHLSDIKNEFYSAAFAGLGEKVVYEAEGTIILVLSDIFQSS